MTEVWAGNQNTIEVLGLQKGVDTINKFGIGCEFRGLCLHACVRLKDYGHLRIGQKRDITEVFLTHHAAADDAVVRGGGHVLSLFQALHVARRCVVKPSA